MEEKIANIILSAAKLPGYKIHPYETYARLKIFGINDIDHPKDLYKADIQMLTDAAKSFAGKHSIKLGATGFATGLPGGPWGMAAGVTADLEEYLRRVFRIAQEIGHVYGLIPMPFVDSVNEDVDEYYSAAQKEILKAILIGVGLGGVSMGIAETAKRIARKEAEGILSKKISDKLITQLANRIARILGGNLTQEQISVRALKFIPILGGVLNSFFCYKSLQFVGNNLINNFEKEHNSVRKNVLKYWQNK